MFRDFVLYPLKTKSKEKIKPPPREVLVQLYWGDGKNQVQVSEKFNVSHFLINQWMKLYNIPIRTGGGKSITRPDIKSEVVKRKYVDELKSICVISLELKCSSYLVSQRLAQVGVVMRTKQEAMRIYYARKGNNNGSDVWGVSGTVVSDRQVGDREEASWEKQKEKVDAC